MKRASGSTSLVLASALSAAVFGGVHRLSAEAEPAMTPAWLYYLAGAIAGAALFRIVSSRQGLLVAAGEGARWPRLYRRFISVAFVGFCIGLLGFVGAAHGVELAGLVVIVLGLGISMVGFLGMAAVALAVLFRRR
jgi:hypothetical protein